MTNILSVQNISKSYPGFLLSDIAFDLQPGYIMGLIGRNGSGKTTIMKLIMNMIKRDSGTITVNGLDNIKQQIKVKKSIGYVCDESIFIDDWKISDVKRVCRMYYEKYDENLFEQYIHRFELPKDRKIKEFSKGMKTKLMLSAALSRDTCLLLMDEPTSGLDPVVRSELLDILQEYIVNGDKSVLFSTHITTDLEKIADYVTFIHNGNQIFSKSRDQALENYRLVRGESADLNERIKNILIGGVINNLGFDGLVLRSDAADMPENIVVENATLDDIIVYHDRRIKDEYHQINKA